MTPRERMNRAIEFGRPDRLPRMHSFWPGTQKRDPEGIDRIRTAYPDDMENWFTRTVWSPDNPFYRVGKYTDAWGCVWTNETWGVQGACFVHPLADWGDWPAYALPPCNGPAKARAVADEISEFGHDHYVIAGSPVPLFQKMINLRGFDELMIDLATEDPAFFILRDAMFEWFLESLEPVLHCECDGVFLADDWGTQTALMTSPDVFRRLFKPIYGEIFSRIRGAGKHVHFHSDGYVLDIVPDLVELGAHVINIEHPLMGERELGALAGGKVCFRTNVDSQHLLPFETPAQVRANVRDVVRHLATPEGGIIAYGECAPDVPLENYRAMLEAFQEEWPGKAAAPPG